MRILSVVLLVVLAAGCGGDEPRGTEGADAQPRDSQAIADATRDSADAGVAQPDAAPTDAAPDAGGISPSTCPGPSTTGVPPGTTLTPSASITVTQNGAVIEDVDVTGRIAIEADDVTVRRFRVRTTGTYGVRIDPGHSGIVIEDGEVEGATSALIYGGGFTARRLNLHDSAGDGIKATNDVVVESSWIHKLGTSAGAHADGVQMVSGAHNVFRFNHYDMPKDLPGYRSNANFFLSTNNGPINDILIESNCLNGGNYTIYSTDHGNGFGAPANVRVIGNLFGRDYGFGIREFDGTVEWRDNRWIDTGDLIP